MQRTTTTNQPATGGRVRAAHTPGPWSTDAAGNTQTSLVLGPVGQVVARIAMCNGRLERSANARLIAAAPALLDALRDVREVLASEGRAWAAMYPPSVPWVNEEKLLRVDAAIAKTEGRS